MYPARKAQHRKRIPVASAPYQRRPGDFFTLSLKCWENPGQIGSHFTSLVKIERASTVVSALRILLYKKRTKASKNAIGSSHQ
jgi:hypothetical protein